MITILRHLPLKNQKNKTNNNNQQQNWQQQQQQQQKRRKKKRKKLKDVENYHVCLPEEMKPLAIAWAIFPPPINPTILSSCTCISHQEASRILHRSRWISAALRRISANAANSWPRSPPRTRSRNSGRFPQGREIPPPAPLPSPPLPPHHLVPASLCRWTNPCRVRVQSTGYPFPNKQKRGPASVWSLRAFAELHHGQIDD